MQTAHSHTASRRIPRLNIEGAYVPGTSLRGAILHRANLSSANAEGADFRDADFSEANLRGTILVGADLTGARNLTVEQLQSAITDETTRLPDYIDRDSLR